VTVWLEQERSGIQIRELPRRSRKIGTLTVALAAVYFVIATKFVLPGFGGGETFYEDVLGPLGSTPTDVTSNLFRQPTLFTDKFKSNDGIGYATRLELPWQFTSLLSPSSLLLGLPTYLLNVSSSQGYTQDLHRRYVTMPFVASVFSSIRGLHSRSRATMRWSLAVGIVLITLWMHQAGAEPWSGRHDAVWGRRDQHADVLDEAVAMVPEDGSVSASDYIVPHLTRRPGVYSFLNPWISSNWGIHDKDPRSPEWVDWILVHRVFSAQPGVADLVARIKSSSCYEVYLDKDQVLLLHRVKHGCDV
jgi:Predicted membrane protein (DUF2079)